MTHTRRWANVEVHAYSKDRTERERAWEKSQREYFKSKRKAERKAAMVQVFKGAALIATALVAFFASISCPAGK